jgi:hypothetical protein
VALPSTYFDTAKIDLIERDDYRSPYLRSLQENSGNSAAQSMRKRLQTQSDGTKSAMECRAKTANFCTA